jgi:hypothetical protein
MARLEPEAFVKMERQWKYLERRGLAGSELPPPHQKDNASINIRKILIEREELGFKRVGPRALTAIKTLGYDAFFVSEMNSYSKIGLSLFHKLAAMGRIELTTEYIVFHNFREILQANCRRRIAILLVSKTPKSR